MMSFDTFKDEVKATSKNKVIEVNDEFIYKFWICFCVKYKLEQDDMEKYRKRQKDE
ncbi:MAG: hypothetical protein ACOC56_06540 [Atribacterota bacterium]